MAALATVAAAGAIGLTGGVSSAIHAADDAGWLRAQDRSFDRPLAFFTSASAETWQVQVGAFGRREAAEAHQRWLVEMMPELAHLAAVEVPNGALTRARFAGLPDEKTASRLCIRLAEYSDCTVVTIAK